MCYNCYLLPLCNGRNVVFPVSRTRADRWTVPLREGGIFTREPYYLRLILRQALNVCFLLFVVIEMGEPLNKYTYAEKSFIPPALSLQRASPEQVS